MPGNKQKVSCTVYLNVDQIEDLEELLRRADKLWPWQKHTKAALIRRGIDLVLNEVRERLEDEDED